MKYFSKKYRLILLLSFLVVLLAEIKYFYKPNWPQQPNNQIQITTIPTPIIKINDEYPLKNILPYYGVNFNILNYSKPLTLVVKIKSKDQEKITKEMLDLFEKQGINIDSHKFEWQD